MPYLSAEQHEIVNIEKVRRKHGILAITEDFVRTLYTYIILVSQARPTSAREGRVW